MLLIKFRFRINYTSIVFFLLCILIFQTVANDFSSKIILEGLKNAHLGGELSYRRVDCRLTGSISAVNNSYWTVDGNLHLGAIVKKDSCYDWIVALGANTKYTHNTFYDALPDIVIDIRPSLNCTMYRYFGKFLVGGNVSLELWEGQKSFHEDIISGWDVNRLFNINPEFVIGYCF